MSTLQLAHAADRVVVEWNKYAPHYRVIIDGHERSYNTKEAAIAAAWRHCRKLKLTLIKDQYDDTQ